jgi:hypothetical protein
VAALPNGQRGPAFGVAQSGLLAAQGLGIVLAGAAARWISPPAVVAVAGMLGVAAAAMLAAGWARHRSLLAESAGERGPAATSGPSMGTPTAGDQAETV